PRRRIAAAAADGRGDRRARRAGGRPDRRRRAAVRHHRRRRGPVAGPPAVRAGRVPGWCTVTGAGVSRRVRWRDRAVAAAGLICMWVLLWGVFSWANLISGLVVSAVVLTVFPLPPLTFAGRPRPLGLLRFALRFVADLVRASAQLSWLAFRVGPQPRSAIIRVPLRVCSDLVLTLTGE